MLGQYRAAPFESWSLGFDREIVRLLADGRTVLVPTAIRTMMNECRTSKTLSDHADQIFQRLKEEGKSRQAVYSGLSEMVVDRLLITDAELCSYLKTKAANPKRIALIALISANRPRQCRETLEGFCGNASKFSKKVEFTVSDDSVERRTRHEYIRELAQVQRRNAPQVICYAGREEKERYILALSGLGIEPDVARFALLGVNNAGIITTGANRNCVLLDAIDDCIMTADDDITANAVRHPGYRQEVHLCGHAYPRDVWFFRDRADAVARSEWASVDIVLEHEKLLGRYVGEVLDDRPGASGVELGSACNHIVEGLLKGSARIPVTIAGVIGDFGGSSANWMLLPSGQIRRELLKSKSAYDLAKTSREVLTVASRPMIVHSGDCMAGNIGLQNDGLLAPFFPIGRGEDGIFGSLMLKMFPGYCCGHLPFALLHDTPEGRQYDVPSQLRLDELVKILVTSCPVPAGTCGLAVLDTIGTYLQAIGELDEPEFVRCVSEIAMMSQIKGLRALWMNFREFSDCPDYWRLDVERWHEQMAAAISRPCAFLPLELRRHTPAESASLETKELLRRAGRMLSAWPSMMEAARDLRRKGVRMAVPVPVLTSP